MKKIYYIVIVIMLSFLGILIYTQASQNKIQTEFKKNFPKDTIKEIIKSNNSKTGLIVTTSNIEYLYTIESNTITFYDNSILIKEFKKWKKESISQIDQKIITANKFLQETSLINEETFIQQRKELWEKASMLTYTIQQKDLKSTESKLNVYYDTPKETLWRQQQKNPYMNISLTELHNQLNQTILEYNKLIDQRDDYYTKMKEYMPNYFSELNSHTNNGLKRWMKIKYKDYKITFTMQEY